MEARLTHIRAMLVHVGKYPKVLANIIMGYYFLDECGACELHIYRGEIFEFKRSTEDDEIYGYFHNICPTPILPCLEMGCKKKREFLFMEYCLWCLEE